MDIGDGDLVRLAREGDATAFRLLVERHRAAARARAAWLGAAPGDVDDLVQEAFLQAFTGLDRLRDPDRFGAWLGGIVGNVHRAAARRAPPVLVADWPEPLHPHSAEGLPSAENLDRAEALRAAVADLPDGQRRAVAAYYYADLPVGQVGASPGAAKASLHKARRRLRAYITAHRPDLIPATSRRIRMTAVRIAHASPVRARGADGEVLPGRVLVVLADEAGHRALPLWLPPGAAWSLWRWLDDQPGRAPGRRPGSAGVEVKPGVEVAAGVEAAVGGEVTAGDHSGAGLTARLLHAAGVTVTAVDVDELGPDVLAARIEVAGPAGPRPVTANLGRGLAFAAEMGAPVRVADALMNRLAVPINGDDLLTPFLDPAASASHDGPLPGPRNLGFADGLDGWIIGGSFRAGVTGAHRRDYRAEAADGRATLASAVDRPHGDAFLGQVVTADAYRGSTVRVRAEVRAEDVAGRAELFLFVVTRDRTPVEERDVLGPAITGRHGWVPQELRAHVPGDAEFIRFGLTLVGRGRVGLRNVTLARTGDGGA